LTDNKRFDPFALLASTPEERIWRWILRDLAAAGQEPALGCEVWRVEA